MEKLKQSRALSNSKSQEVHQCIHEQFHTVFYNKLERMAQERYSMPFKIVKFLLMFFVVFRPQELALKRSKHGNGDKCEEIVPTVDRPF